MKVAKASKPSTSRATKKPAAAPKGRKPALTKAGKGSFTIHSAPITKVTAENDSCRWSVRLLGRRTERDVSDNTFRTCSYPWTEGEIGRMSIANESGRYSSSWPLYKAALLVSRLMQSYIRRMIPSTWAVKSVRRRNEICLWSVCTLQEKPWPMLVANNFEMPWRMLRRTEDWSMLPKVGFCFDNLVSDCSAFVALLQYWSALHRISRLRI